MEAFIYDKYGPPQTLRISRGSRNAPPRTPVHRRYFPGMCYVPFPFPVQGQPSDPGTFLQVPPG
jgi:hypothetical protein